VLRLFGKLFKTGRVELLRRFEKSGIEVFVVFLRYNGGKYGGISIVVKCPRCGKYGKLSRNGKRKVLQEERFKVKHEKGSCGFGVLSDENKVFSEIYAEVRNDELLVHKV